VFTKSTQQNINIENLAAGIYYAIIETEKEKVTKKFVKN
jgi:hypothetical protein